MNSNVVGPNQIIKVGPMQVDKLNGLRYLSSWPYARAYGGRLRGSPEYRTLSPLANPGRLQRAIKCAESRPWPTSMKDRKSNRLRGSIPSSPAPGQGSIKSQIQPHRAVMMSTGV